MIGREELKKLFHYNPRSGLFTRLIVRNRNLKVGSIAGTKSKQSGYIHIKIDGKSHLAHRLAFLYVTGSIPVEVDHDNRVKDDNRWENLNDGTHQDNMKNFPKRVDNTSDTTGVHWYETNKRWIARISVDGKRVNLGSFVEYHEAVNARKNAEVLYGFHKNHGT